ncbi:uncharacterized protein LOC119575879 [Penaeus monodon]|uniref:uncharacterized protein LOC119575879 n=1 Tax=Penaeus monodon TaxID=6687 RepID=UPI0018A6D75B|nr:uncharacterized protein LOC119575879 [Penaeus monodon]
MSRQLSVRRGRKPRISPAVRDLSFSDVDDPQPSTSGIQRLRNAPDPLLYLYSTDEEDYTPPLKLPRTSDLSEVEISTRFDGDDSDWEGSEFDTEESGVDDDSDEDLTMSRWWIPLWTPTSPSQNTSDDIGSRENFVRRHCFEGTPGVKAPLEDSSTPLEVFTSVFPEELFQTIVDETNRGGRTQRCGKSAPMSAYDS